MFIGLFIFKFIPMTIWGHNIKFDASAHITIAMFCLYIIWFFIDQNKTWRLVFFIFALAVLSIISIQRILVDAHNDVGLLGGFILSCLAILHAQKHALKGKFKF
jgi:membrane-associated phospholipid phosphatase